MKITPERIEEIEAAILGHLASSIRADLLSERREREKEIERLEHKVRKGDDAFQRAASSRERNKTRAESAESERDALKKQLEEVQFLADEMAGGLPAYTVPKNYEGGKWEGRLLQEIKIAKMLRAILDKKASG